MIQNLALGCSNSQELLPLNLPTGLKHIRSRMTKQSVVRKFSNYQDKALTAMTNVLAYGLNIHSAH